jgi:uncharacterized protein YdhG (YjbR/CyaY superfamily)
MKKAKSYKGKSAAEVKSGSNDVDEYFARVPEPARSMLNEMRAAIRWAVPREATETISYKMPAFRDKEILVWYAAFSDHCSLFPKASVISAFKSELAGLSTSKGTIHFPIAKPLPVALIKKLVKARVAETKNKRGRGGA